MEAKTIKIHGIYIIVILVIINIGIGTFKWGDNELLVGYFSFAGTISSILLAVIAIIYSFISNNSLSSSLSSFNSTSKEFSETSKKITEATEALKNKLDEIPLLLKPIEEKADITNAKIEQLSNIAQTEKSPNTLSEKPVTSITQKQIDPDIIIQYVQQSSFLGKLALYACKLSLEKSKPFKFEDINSLITYPSKDYMTAYYVSASSLGLILTKNTQELITIVEIHKTIKENIKDSIYFYAKMHDNDPQNASFARWENDIKTFENFFNL
jgi:hypothetical protein